MHNALITVYMIILFFLLTPKILTTFPKKGSKYTVALAHTIIFVTVWKITVFIINYLTNGLFETFDSNNYCKSSSTSSVTIQSTNTPIIQTVVAPVVKATEAPPGPNNGPNIIFTNISKSIDNKQNLTISGNVLCYPNDGKWDWGILIQNQGGQINGVKQIKSGNFTLTDRSNIVYKPGNYVFGFAPSYNGNSLWGKIGYGYWNTEPNDYGSTVAFNISITDNNSGS